MMMRDCPERDWKVFRRVRALALERFCKRVLDGLDRFGPEGSGTCHDRYLELYQYVQDRDRELARAFDNPRRSDMLMQLAALIAVDVILPEELAEFTPQTRERAETFIKIISSSIAGNSGTKRCVS